MDAALGSLLNFYSFSTGRRIFALQQVQKIASDTGFKELAAHITPALKHDAKTHEIELQWSRIPVTAPRGQAETQRVDALTDRTLTAIRDTAMAQATSADPDDPIGPTVDTFLGEIFPLGAGCDTPHRLIAGGRPRAEHPQARCAPSSIAVLTR